MPKGPSPTMRMRSQATLRRRFIFRAAAPRGISWVAVPPIRASNACSYGRSRLSSRYIITGPGDHADPVFLAILDRSRGDA